MPLINDFLIFITILIIIVINYTNLYFIIS